MTPDKSRRLLTQNATKFIAVAAGITWAAGLLGACAPAEKPQFKSIDMTGADYAKDFSLTDQNGARRSLKDFAGKLVVVFFGFTQCPDVCPTTMAEMAQIKKILGSSGSKLQGIFITVDPERDTQEVLKAYVGNFDPSFVALRPTAAELPELAKAFKVYYKKVDGKTPTSYSMDHSAGSFVYDTQGRLRLYTRYGTGPELLASDLKLLLASA